MADSSFECFLKPTIFILIQNPSGLKPQHSCKMALRLNLNQITVPVLSVPRSIEFYKALGLHLIVHTSDDYARFECPAGDSTFSLHKVDSLPTGSTGIWIYFEVEDVDATVAEIEERLGQDAVKEKPEDKSWRWREARLNDVDGNVIILYTAGEDRKNPPWRLKADQK
jgi:catechol 2,3-dioxygenase-like lactoylglutathione lyase family enzyme